MKPIACFTVHRGNYHFGEGSVPEVEENQKKEFLIEKFKERPVNQKMLIRRTLITVGLAVVFGLVACVTFLVLEPFINQWLYPEEEAQIVVFPQDQEEMSPEDMLSDNMQLESQVSHLSEIMENITLDKGQIESILSNIMLSKDNYRQLYDALSEYSNHLNKCMVTVTGETSNIDWFNNVEVSSKQSCGVILANNNKQLVILANYAPLKWAEQLTLTFYNGLQAPAELKESDAELDLAIVTVDLSNLKPEMVEDSELVATLGSSNSKYLVGTPVVALGSPMGTKDSMGYGMVTSYSVQSNLADFNYKIMQTDIYGSPTAGGVLFNLYGQVIGIITNNKSSDMRNVIVAYGISDFKNLIEKMSNGTKMAYLGICGMDVTQKAHDELRVPYGAFVKDVELDSPSMLAGIQQGDVLVSLNDKTISNYAEYTLVLSQLQPNQKVKLTLMRQVQDQYKEVKLEVTVD